MYNVQLDRFCGILSCQQWFWTEKWQAGEGEAQAEIDAGKIKSFDSMADFLEDLRENDHKD